MKCKQYKMIYYKCTQLLADTPVQSVGSPRPPPSPTWGGSSPRPARGSPCPSFWTFLAEQLVSQKVKILVKLQIHNFSLPLSSARVR